MVRVLGWLALVWLGFVGSYLLLTAPGCVRVCTASVPALCEGPPCTNLLGGAPVERWWLVPLAVLAVAALASAGGRRRIS